MKQVNGINCTMFPEGHDDPCLTVLEFEGRVIAIFTEDGEWKACVANSGLILCHGYGLLTHYKMSAEDWLLKHWESIPP